jgi:hypothetical protein
MCTYRARVTQSTDQMLRWMQQVEASVACHVRWGRRQVQMTGLPVSMAACSTSSSAWTMAAKPRAVRGLVSGHYAQVARIPCQVRIGVGPGDGLAEPHGD